MKKTIIFATALLASSGVMAQQNAIGISLGYGAQSIEVEGENVSAGDLMSFSAYYRRMVNDQIGVEGGWYGATEGIVTTVVNGVSETVKDAGFSGPRAVFYGELPLNDYVALYGKAGANYYTLSYKIDGQEHSKGALGGEAAIGSAIRVGMLDLHWEYTYLANRYVGSGVVSLGATVYF